MWLAGSFAAISPSHAYLCVLFGANRLPPNVFGETACGSLGIGLFGANGYASMQTITVYQSGLGDLHLRIPVGQGMAVTTIAVPLPKLAREGLLHGVVLQSGKSATDASDSPEVTRIDDDRLTFAGIERSGRYYRAQNEDGCLLIPVDPPREKVAIYSVSLTSLSHDRTAAAGGGAGAKA